MSPSEPSVGSEPPPRTVEELEERLSRPTPRVVADLGELPGDIVVLGVGGKMGPTLARMAKRASDEAGVERRVIGVSRFSDEAARERLNRWGVETIAGDLLNERFVASLPEAANVVYMAGFKFGASAQPWMTWAMNCYLPALVCRKYAHSRIVAFSTGNVYGLVPNDSDGSIESDAPNPVGEYAMAALGRERMFEYFSRSMDVSLVLLRLNYATEMRYGVLVDLAQQIWTGQPIDLAMGRVNVIWQGDANALPLSALAHTASPPSVINVAGDEILIVRDVCERLGVLLGKTVEFVGEESADALISNGRRGHDLLGRPHVGISSMLEWTADWVSRGGPTLGKPTKFQSRDGTF